MTSPQSSTKAEPTAASIAASAVGFLVVMELGSGLLQGWYATLLASLGKQFQVGAAELNWVTTAYLLSTVSFAPILGKLGDRYGHKKMLAVAAGIVTIGSALAAVAPTFGLLLLGRALQGALAAFLPLEFAIVRNRDPHNAGRNIGRLVGALTFGGAAGAFISGILLQSVGNLRLVLWVPAIFMLIAVVVLLFLVPESTARTQGRIDWVGAALLGVGLLGVLTGIANASAWGWGSPLTLTSIAAGLALLVGWVLVERRIANPLIDLSLLTRGGLGVMVVIGMLFGATLFGTQVPNSVWLLSDPAATGVGLGQSGGFVGLLYLVSALLAFTAASQAHRLVKRFGRKATLAVGGVILTIAYLGMTLMPASLAIFAGCLLLTGLGNGFLIAVLPDIVVNLSPEDSVGVSSALYNSARTGGGAVAGAIFSLVMGTFAITAQVQGKATLITTQVGYSVVWGICTALAAIVLVACLLLREHRPDERPATSAAETPRTEAAQGTSR